MNLTLNKISQTIKSEWLFILLGLLSITGFSVAIFSFLTKGIQKTPPGTAWQNNIFAGTTTKKELEDKLGPPVNVTQKDNNTIYTYSSASQFRPHEVDLTRNTVSIIKEQVVGDEKGKLADYIQKYGQPEAILIGQHGYAAPGHFWGKDGIMVFANDFDGTIIEIWYFEPSQLVSFLAKHPELSKEPPKLF